MSRKIVIDSPRHIANGRGATTKSFESEEPEREALEWLLSTQPDTSAHIYHKVEDINGELAELEDGDKSAQLRKIKEYGDREVRMYGKRSRLPIAISSGDQGYSGYVTPIAAVVGIAESVLDDPDVQIREEHPGAGFYRIYSLEEDRGEGVFGVDERHMHQ